MTVNYYDPELIVKYVDNSVDKNYGFIPYTISAHHERPKWTKPLFNFYDQIFGDDRIMEDDNHVVSVLKTYAKKFNVDFRTIIINYFNAIRKRRKEFIIDSQKRERERYDKVIHRAEQLLDEPKKRKDELRKLLCHSFEELNMTDEEFESWFKNVYSKHKKNEVIQEKHPKPKPKSFIELLDELISSSTRELTFNEFRHEIRSFPATEMSDDEAYARYLNGIEQRKDVIMIKQPDQPIPIPFKTKYKQNYLIIDDKYPFLKPKKLLTNSFPNNRRFNLHAVAPHGLFIIDFMFVDETCYLVAIELNTRKLYVEPTNIVSDRTYETNGPLDQSHFMAITKDKKNHILYLTALKKIMSSGANIKALRGDGEGAFIDKDSLKFYNENNIKFYPVPRIKLTSGKTEPNHTSLAVIDRVIRTLRDMSYNSGLKLTPTTIKQFAQIYNDTPHSTLSKVMNFNVTPNMVSSDIGLETEICRRIEQQNYNIINHPMFDVPEGVECTVLESYDQFAKKRSKIKPDLYKVIGFKDNKYVLQNVNTGKKIKESRANINPQTVF